MTHSAVQKSFIVFLGIAITASIFVAPFSALAKTGALEVKTHVPEFMSGNRVRFKGELSHRDTGSRHNTTAYFEWGESSSLNRLTSSNTISSVFEPASFSTIVDDIAPHKQYFFRAVGEDLDGKERGRIIRFRISDKSWEYHDNVPYDVPHATYTYIPAPYYPPYTTGYSCDGYYYYDDCRDDRDRDRPDARTDSATRIDGDSARLNARIDPNGSDTDAWFEWGLTRSLGNQTRIRDIGSSSSSRDFSETIDGLREDTTHYFRVVARNRNGTDAGDIRSFRTDDRGGRHDDRCGEYYDGGYCDGLGGPAQTVALTDAPSHVTGTSARLNATIDPRGSFTDAWFEWGPSPALGNRTAIRPAGPPFAPSRFWEAIGGLRPNTAYYFRIVAQGRSGIATGAIRSFITAGGYAAPTYYESIPPAQPAPTPAPTYTPPPAPAPEPAPPYGVEEENGFSRAQLFSGAFFPNTIVGWLVLVISIFLLVVLLLWTMLLRDRMKEDRARREAIRNNHISAVDR